MAGGGGPGSSVLPGHRQQLLLCRREDRCPHPGCKWAARPWELTSRPVVLQGSRVPFRTTFWTYGACISSVRDGPSRETLHLSRFAVDEASGGEEARPAYGFLLQRVGQGGEWSGY